MFTRISGHICTIHFLCARVRLGSSLWTYMYLYARVRRIPDVYVQPSPILSGGMPGVPLVYVRVLFEEGILHSRIDGLVVDPLG